MRSRRRPRRFNPALVAALGACACLLAFAGTGCGIEKESEVVEGEPLELGDLSFNVQFTRFLNRNDREDGEYLQGQPPPGVGNEYLAVFMQVANEGDEPATLPDAEQIEVVDTTGAVFEPRPSTGLFGLKFGAELEPGAELPRPDTAAAAGPIKGAMVLFAVDRFVTENRPLELQIRSGGEAGQVALDI